MDHLAIFTGEKLKQGMLLTFVGAALLLIGMTWAENMRPSQPNTPAYYRQVATPVVPQGVMPTMAPHRGSGNGRSDGSHDEHATTPAAQGTPAPGGLDDGDPSNDAMIDE